MDGIILGAGMMDMSCNAMCKLGRVKNCGSRTMADPARELTINWFSVPSFECNGK
jgi:hypothetical protein